MSWPSRSRTTRIGGAIDRFLSGRNNTSYAPLVYSRLGDLYVEKERYQDAASVYRAYAAREPNSEYSPDLSMQAIEAYRKGGFTELVLEGKHEYVELYNYGTRSGRAATGLTTRRSSRNSRPTSRTSPPISTPRAEVEEVRGVPRGGEVVSRLSQIIPGRTGFPGTNYLLSETLF